MAENKTTKTDLRKTLSKQTSLPEEAAKRFLDAFVPTIVDGLHKDGIVRIAGLGSFKMVQVAPRKSVNISTGETYLLEGYSKVTFLPESFLREQINEPFAGLEAIRVDENGQPLDPQSTLQGIDPRERFDQQADEIKGILAELDLDNPEIQETPETQETPDDVQVPVSQETPDNPESPETPDTSGKPRFRGWIVALSTILVLLAMLVVGYFVLVNKLEDWANHLGTTPEEDEFVLPNEESLMLDMELLQPLDSLAEESDTLSEKPNSISGDTTTYQPTILAIETVQAGSRLAQIARRYYGDPNKWTIVYEANKEVIADPNNLQAGTKLRIPKLQ